MTSHAKGSEMLPVWRLLFQNRRLPPRHTTFELKDANDKVFGDCRIKLEGCECERLSYCEDSGSCHSRLGFTGAGHRICSFSSHSRFITDCGYRPVKCQSLADGANRERPRGELWDSC